MRILTCLKQVREPQGLLGLEQGRPLWAEPARHKISACDEFALEEALRLAEVHPGAEVCCLTVGPPGAEEILRRALGMGATQAVHLLTPAGADLRPPELAKAMADWASGHGFDPPVRRRAGVVLEGSTADKAAALLGILRERGLL